MDMIEQQKIANGELVTPGACDRMCVHILQLILDARREDPRKAVDIQLKVHPSIRAALVQHGRTSYDEVGKRYVYGVPLVEDATAAVVRLERTISGALHVRTMSEPKAQVEPEEQLELPDVTIGLYSGARVNPFKLREEDVCIDDIANALANLSRFGGHTYPRLSVATHSVSVAMQLPEEHQLTGLLHDAKEAYIGGDLIAPLIPYVAAPLWHAMDKHVERVICRVFGLIPAVLEGPVLKADLLVREAEQARFARRNEARDPSVDNVELAPLAVDPKALFISALECARPNHAFYNHD